MEQQAALSEVRSQWRRMGNDFDASWAAIAGSVVGVTESAQRRVARSSAAYVPDVLDDLGRPRDIGPSARMNVGPLVGVTGAGIGLAESFFAAVVVAKIGVSRGLTTPQSLARGENILMGRASLAISDAGRAAERVRLAPTRVTHYQRALTLPSCARCVVLADRLYRMEQAFQRHPQCFPEGVVASGPALDAASRRWYEGELVVLTTASGQELPITGNHPVLTRRGWVPANLLNEGDEVLRSTRPQGAGALMVPDHDQVPARVEDIWGSFAVSGLDSVESSPEDFHGDGQDGKVDIVWSDRALNRRAVSALFQHGLEQSFAGGAGAASSLYSEGASELLDLWDASVAGGFVGLGDLSLPLGLREGFVPGLACGAHVAQFDPHVGHAFGDGTSGYGVFAGQRVQAGPGFVLPDDFSHRDVGSGLPRWDAPGAKYSVETREGYASAGLDLLHRLSGQVEADRIVKLVRRDFRGHVYSLSSSEGWHVANSLIVSNCDCRHLPSGQMEDGPTGDAREYFESLSEAEQDRIFTKAGAEAIRNGADISQVVNARRGMYTTTGYDGKQWKFTREGTTRRGSYGSGFRSPRYEGVQQPKAPRRLMPEQIQAIARDKEEYLRLLERYGYFYY